MVARRVRHADPNALARLRYEWVGSSFDEPHRLVAVGEKRTQEAGSHASAPNGLASDPLSSTSAAGPPEVPGVEVAAERGWCDARRVEDLEVQRRDVAMKQKLVGYSRHMRLHITVDDELIAELDRRAGSRRRSAFIAELIRRGLDDERRWDDIEAALGAISDEGHEWDDDPGEWVRRQRSDRRRVG